MSDTALETIDKMTTIKLHASVRKRLAGHATKDQTYEDLIIQLLDRIERVSAWAHLFFVFIVIDH